MGKDRAKLTPRGLIEAALSCFSSIEAQTSDSYMLAVR